MQIVMKQSFEIMVIYNLRNVCIKELQLVNIVIGKHCNYLLTGNSFCKKKKNANCRNKVKFIMLNT